MKSDVYLIRVESKQIEVRQAALKKLLDEVKPFAGYKKEEFIPVKITIGDSPCVYQVSPELVKVVIAQIKKQQAKPFLFDTSVIYQGQRQNAVDHMNLAQSKGFGHTKVGAPFIVADGVFGKDGKEFILDNPETKKIKTPSFVGMLDSLVVISHTTGHILAGFAAAIKNVAMGMSCRSTKQVQHSTIKPSVIVKKCTACGCCLEICPVQAISYKDNKAFIDPKLCIGCAECLCACKFDAIYVNYHEDPLVFNRRMVEVAQFILSKFKNKFYLNFSLDITKECDCIADKDEKMVAADIGILCSYDILALDKATADLAQEYKKGEYFSANSKVYNALFEYAAGKGLGNLDYNLIQL